MAKIFTNEEIEIHAEINGEEGLVLKAS